MAIVSNAFLEFQAYKPVLL